TGSKRVKSRTPCSIGSTPVIIVVHTSGESGGGVVGRNPRPPPPPRGAGAGPRPAPPARAGGRRAPPARPAGAAGRAPRARAISAAVGAPSGPRGSRCRARTRITIPATRSAAPPTTKRDLRLPPMQPRAIDAVERVEVPPEPRQPALRERLHEVVAVAVLV